MLVEAHVTIHASKAAVWSAITDMENAAKMITGIESLEILERPAKGLVGLRWRETRMYFGKPASVEKQVTEAVDGESYKTHTQSDGSVFLATLRISGGDGEITLTSAHKTIPQTLGKKLLWAPMGLVFRGMLRKALLADLNDIKAAVERGPAIQAH